MAVAGVDVRTGCSRQTSAGDYYDLFRSAKSFLEFSDRFAHGAARPDMRTMQGVLISRRKGGPELMDPFWE